MTTEPTTWRDRPADSPIWCGEIGDFAYDASPTDDEIATGYAAESVAHFQRWNAAMSDFIKAPDDEDRRAALRAAHDRHFAVATTAFAAAALAKGWKPADVREALEMGDASEHVYSWLWEGLSFEENAEMDAFLARLVTDRQDPASGPAVAEVVDAPMTVGDMAEGQRTAFGLARAMGSGDTQAVGAVLAGMTTIQEIRRALMGSAAMCAWIVRETGMDWAALSWEMERRLSR